MNPSYTPGIAIMLISLMYAAFAFEQGTALLAHAFLVVTAIGAAEVIRVRMRRVRDDEIIERLRRRVHGKRE